MRVNPITSIEELLSTLYIDMYNCQKTDTCVECLDTGSIIVREYFDGGSGCSRTFSFETTPLDLAVFTEAKERGYITGVLEPGHVSTTNFKLTPSGEEEILRIREAAEAKEEAEAKAEKPQPKL